MSNVTIRSVAKQAGVSVATVSRVINQAPGVRPKTVKKVNEAIAATNYIPNSVARNLKTDATKTIGFLISNISNSHFTSMAKTIESFMREKDYSIIVCSTDDDPDIELSYIHRLLGLRVDGLILNTTGQNSAYITELSHILPMVLVDRSISTPSFTGDFVGSNNFDGIQTLTKHLIKNGHRKIGIITSNLQVSTGQERLAGFQAAMQTIGIKADSDYIYRYDSNYFNEESGIDGCQYLMSLQDPPTAIVVTNNAMAIGAYKYLLAKGISVPGDVSVVSYGNISNSELFRTEPTYVTLNPVFMGEKAAKLLLSRIENPELSNREVIFEPLFIENNSTRIL